MWQEQRLGKICELISGQHILSKDYNTENQGIGYLTGPADFGLENPSISKWTESPKVKAQEGDILLTVKGSGVGKTNILDVDEVAISRQLMAVRVKGADTRFIYNFLVSRFDDLQDLATGAAIPGLSRKQILSFYSFHSLPSQNNNASSPFWMTPLSALMQPSQTPKRTSPMLGSCLKAI